MHVLSSVMGYALPALMPRAYTHLASAVCLLQCLLSAVKRLTIAVSLQVLFLYFGYRLLKDAYDMDGAGPSEELQEVEEELRRSKGDRPFPGFTTSQ
jgi:putative Ca2+/H+ antiporter (TMEM165/GDT1 family)